MSRSINPRSDKIINLASREQPGRRQLIEQLFDQHVGVLRLFLRGWSVSQEETEDVVQELFTRLMGLDRLEQKMADSTLSGLRAALQGSRYAPIHGFGRRLLR